MAHGLQTKHQLASDSECTWALLCIAVPVRCGVESQCTSACVLEIHIPQQQKSRAHKLKHKRKLSRMETQKRRKTSPHKLKENGRMGQQQHKDTYPFIFFHVCMARLPNRGNRSSNIDVEYSLSGANAFTTVHYTSCWIPFPLSFVRDGSIYAHNATR